MIKNGSNNTGVAVLYNKTWYEYDSLFKIQHGTNICIQQNKCTHKCLPLILHIIRINNGGVTCLPFPTPAASPMKNPALCPLGRILMCC